MEKNASTTESEFHSKFKIQTDFSSEIKEDNICNNCEMNTNNSKLMTTMVSKLVTSISSMKEMLGNLEIDETLISNLRGKVNEKNIYSYYNKVTKKYVFYKDSIKNTNTNTIDKNNEKPVDKNLLNKSSRIKDVEKDNSNFIDLELIAYSKFKNKRYITGWDEFTLKTENSVNPLIQCWIGGFLEGLSTSEEIGYYVNNLNVFFHNKPELSKEIKDFFTIIHNNLIKKDEDILKFKFRNISDIKKKTYESCIISQLQGLNYGYNLVSDVKLSIEDFYLMNAEGNIPDMINLMEVNKMEVSTKDIDFMSKENLQKIYKTDDLTKIWQNLTKRGHCSAIVKMITKNDGKYDVLLGHNTWTDYSEMLRMIKEYDFAFEGEKNKLLDRKNVEDISEIPKMNSVKITFSSYPGVLFSGDDFYVTSNNLAIAQTTLTSINKYIYKDLIDMNFYVPEFIRIMTTNYISQNGKEWFLNYKSYSSHIYSTQWLILDYKVLKKINDLNSIENNITGLLTLIEEVPKSVIGSDVSLKLMKDKFYISFNMSYFKQHQDILGINDLKKELNIHSIENNPRYYIYSHLDKSINDIKSLSKAIVYNGFNNKKSNIPNDPSYSDPSNGISSRDDLNTHDEEKVPHGGVDFKVSLYK